jgi:hypothetical protein
MSKVRVRKICRTLMNPEFSSTFFLFVVLISKRFGVIEKIIKTPVLRGSMVLGKNRSTAFGVASRKVPFAVRGLVTKPESYLLICGTYCNTKLFYYKHKVKYKTQYC